MKKLVLGSLAIMTLMLTVTMNAQSDKGLFFSLNGGYNFSSASQSFGSNTSETTSSFTDERVTGSLGKGINVGGAIGYMFNKNIVAELGINYLIGGETKSNDVRTNPGSFKNDETIYSSNMLQFRPTIILTAGMEKINPYAKFGMLIGSGSFTITETSSNSTSSGNKTNKFDGGTAFGFHAGLGLLYNVNAKIAVFGELNMVNLSYAPSKGTLTADNKNGVDQLIGASVRDTQTEFVDSYSESDATPSTSPSKALKEYFAFSSFGINFGLKYSL